MKMEFKATLKTDSIDAECIASALDVDNVNMENLKISTKADGGEILTHIESNNLKTLINTIDDVINSQMIAERIIN